MNGTHDDGQDLYLEPAVEINREAVDPVAAQTDDIVVICGSGC
jgi:hypothetical protein